jgi:hypothetical protein
MEPMSYPENRLPAGIRGLAAFFLPIGLDETVGSASLMRRVDVKYAASEGQLAAVLQDCFGHYSVLEIDGRRVARYETEYFDTPEMGFYHEHHAGRPRRRKVRIRRYADSGDAYLEVKQRQADGRTVKARVAMMAGQQTDIVELLSGPVFQSFGPLQADRLYPGVSVSFHRMTLVDPLKMERVTIDHDVTFRLAGRALPLPGLVVAEVKQSRAGFSRFRDSMRVHGIRPGSLSKYCLGAACLHGQVKKNLFKARIRRILQLTGHETAPAIQ